MPKKAVINPKNPLYLARLDAIQINPTLSNREKAARELCISKERLEKIETGKDAPKLDELEAMAKTYQLPRLKQRFCNDCCPYRVNGYDSMGKARASG